MLMSVGPIVFDLTNNLVGYDLTSEQDFARKDVIGARRPVEHMGAGTETLTLNGVLYPEKLGGAGAVDALITMKELGFPQLVMRGDGMVMGFFVITRVDARGEHLNAAGQPRRIDCTVVLEKVNQPLAASVFQSLITLFG